ncbi:MAG: hypothetical protein BWY67_01753 [Bacteroidetes bacterium ADurb.Bin397]|nr:MAG: hypothetical protein BWY67_01753 [Bacteroidetes bacterium ADurb.Bin397]
MLSTHHLSKTNCIPPFGSNMVACQIVAANGKNESSNATRAADFLSDTIRIKSIPTRGNKSINNDNMPLSDNHFKYEHKNNRNYHCNNI